MSKLQGLFRKQRGSVGDVTFRQVHGDTIVSEKSTNPAQPRTPAQMRMRVRWRNIQNLFRAFSGTLHPSFEARPRNWSDVTAFMSANLGQNPVYLTKSQAEQGGCVVAPYQITRGSLPALNNDVDEGGRVFSSINLGELSFTNDTTVSDLAEAIVTNNEEWHYGDQLSAYVLRQTQNDVTGVPYVAVKAYEVTLDSADATPLSELLDSPEAFTKTAGGKLGMTVAVDGAVAYVHSRKEASKTRVSTQSLIVTSNIASRFTDAAAYTAALLSYGGKLEQPFLTPNIDDVVAPI